MSEAARAQDLRPQFRLRLGRDDALIAWLTSVEPRRRSTAIRDALSSYLSEGDDGDTKSFWDEDPDLAAALDRLF